jgi:hypothetical protein
MPSVIRSRSRVVLIADTIRFCRAMDFIHFMSSPSPHNRIIDLTRLSCGLLPANFGGRDADGGGSRRPERVAFAFGGQRSSSRHMGLGQ